MMKLREWMVGATLACLWACGSPEQATVDQFFRAAQTNDSPTLAAMSAASPPGEVASWKVVEVASRSTEAFALPELRQRLEASEKERDAAVEEGRKYLLDEQDALDRIIPKVQEDSEYKFTGKLGEIQEEWTRLVEERRQKERAYQELRRAVDSETRLATKSIMNRVKIEEFDGDVAVTEMLLNLTSPEGQENPFKVTLRKYALSGRESERIEPSRWIIVDIEGTTPEARAVAAAAREPSFTTAEPGAATETPAAAAPARADATPAPAAEPPARTTPMAANRELKGLARVQILAPETKVEGNNVISTLRVRNVSRGWITRFGVTEFWYDDQGNATRGGSRTLDERFMPGEVVELELKTTKDPKFYQNQFEFSHANGQVEATVVSSFPTSD